MENYLLLCDVVLLSQGLPEAANVTGPEADTNYPRAKTKGTPDLLPLNNARMKIGPSTMSHSANASSPPSQAHLHHSWHQGLNRYGDVLAWRSTRRQMQSHVFPHMYKDHVHLSRARKPEIVRRKNMKRI